MNRRPRDLTCEWGSESDGAAGAPPPPGGVRGGEAERPAGYRPARSLPAGPGRILGLRFRLYFIFYFFTIGAPLEQCHVVARFALPALPVIILDACFGAVHLF